MLFLNDIEKFRDLPTRYDISKVLSEFKVKKIAEIGVFKGYNLSYLIKCNPELAIAIDIWKSCDYYHFWDDGVFHKHYTTVLQLALRNRCILPIRMDGIEASKLFPDNHFDFIYIDAQHDYESAVKNIAAWLPKVKKGWFLGGHDYYDGPWEVNEGGISVMIDVGVKRAVDEVVKDKKLKLVTCGNKDRTLSWILKK